MALDPQTAFPAPINIADCGATLKTRPPIHMTNRIVAVICSKMKITPDQPNVAILLSVTFSPSTAIPISIGYFSAHFTPAFQRSCANNVFPKTIPINIANASPPSEGKYGDNNFATIDTAKVSKIPATILRLIAIILLSSNKLLFLVYYYLTEDNGLFH